MKIGLFITCLTDSFYPRTGIAVVKVLEHLGHRVEFPRAQTCCGQPMFNNGFQREATTLAARMIRIFEPCETVVTPSGSCAAMIREHYPTLFAPESREHQAARALAEKTYEFVELLVKVLGVDLRELGVRWAGSATVHDSCHLRGLGLAGETTRLARQIDGLDHRPPDRPRQCCGFGGTFALNYPPISGGMVDDKVQCLIGTGAETVISNDTGCTMNLAGACRRSGHALRFASLAEIIAEGLGLLERETST